MSTKKVGCLSKRQRLRSAGSTWDKSTDLTSDESDLRRCEGVN